MPWSMTGHNRTAQRAADSDQFCTAVAQAMTSTSVASIDNSNNHIVKNSIHNQSPPKDTPHCYHPSNPIPSLVTSAPPSSMPASTRVLG